MVPNCIIWRWKRRKKPPHRENHVNHTIPPMRSDVFVFHHPSGGPVKCSPGQFEAYEDEDVKSRVRYDAPTLYGSSGGAVLNANFDLVALHHAGDNAKPPKFNQGIPIHLIKKDIDRQLEERQRAAD